MKKSLFLIVLSLCFLLSGCLPAFLQEPSVSANEDIPPVQPENTPAFSLPSPEDFPEHTLPEPEAAQPPEEAQYQDRWTPILAGRKMTASHWFIYDCQAKAFLTTSGDPEAPVFPASVTKLFAAYVALQYLQPEDTLTAGSELELIPEDASVAGLKEGDQLKVSQLIDAMMLPSGNDATYVIATAIGRMLAEDTQLEPEAAIARFVEQMNRHAALVGLTDTHFVSPDGWHDEGHYTSMEDLVKIGMLAWTHPVISQSAATTVSESLSMDEERSLQWYNTNLLLHEAQDLYCPYAVGLKTGFTTPAGQCLLSAFEAEGRKILIGVFGCPNSYDRYAETLLLFTQAFDMQIPELPTQTEPAE